MKVGIVGQKGNSRAAFLAARIRETLPDDVTVWLDSATAAAFDGDGDGRPVEEMDDADLVVSIGGDGTFLFAARGAGSTPILGVNLGEVGFLNGVAPREAVETVESVVATYRETGDIPSREAPRLTAGGDGDWVLPPALNEVVVQGPQRGHGNGIEYEVRVDGRLFAGGRGDGVLVSTSTGSTAYNLSEGGPVVHPEVDALVVTEMCAAESMPPLAVPDDSEIEIRAADAEHGFVSGDSTRKRFETPEWIRVRVADEPARIAEPASDFFEALGKLD